MASFKEQLTGAHKDAVVADLVSLTERTVDAQSGISGKLVQGAYKAGKKVDSGLPEKAMRGLLPELASDLEPFWDEYAGGDRSGSFGEFLDARKEQVSSILLETADRQAGKVNNPTINKVYSPIRGKVAKIVEKTVPEIGDTLAKYVEG